MVLLFYSFFFNLRDVHPIPYVSLLPATMAKRKLLTSSTSLIMAERLLTFKFQSP